MGTSIKGYSELSYADVFMEAIELLEDMGVHVYVVTEPEKPKKNWFKRLFS